MIPLVSHQSPESADWRERVWIGTWSMAGEMYGRSDARESVRLLQRAFDAGFVRFDTAGFYAHGFSETLLRRALGKRRNEIFLCTKGGLSWQGKTVLHDASAATLRRQLYESFERLGTDYCDLYMLHWPAPATPVEESLDALRGLQKEGLIRYYGVCNLSADEISRTILPGSMVPHQTPFNPLRMDDELILAKGRNGARCFNVVISPFEQGLLGGTSSHLGATSLGKKDVRQRNPRFHDPAVLALAARYRRLTSDHKLSLSALVLWWLLQRGDVDAVIPGPRNTAQLDELIALADRPISDDTTREYRDFEEFLIATR